MTTSHFRVLIGFVLIVAVGLSVATAILVVHINDNTDAINALERSDANQLRQENRDQQHAIAAAHAAIRAARQAEYRICVRQMVVRATINSDRRRDERVLPLYRCEPNLAGREAVRMTAAQARVFERWVMTAPVSQLP